MAICGALLYALWPGFGVAQAQAPQQEPLREVTAAIPGHFPPQYVVTEEGELSGFAVEVAERVAALAGIRFTYVVEENWQAATEAIRSGRAEVSINNGITEARKALYDYTAPLETFRVSIFVREDTRDIASLNDLAGRRVAVERTHVGVRLLEPRQDIELVLTDDTPATIFALLSGQADAMVYAEPVIWKVAREARVDGRIKVVGTPLVEIKRAMAVRKGNPELLDRLDRAVRAFVVTAEFREIYAKWYGRPEPYWTVDRVLWMTGALLFLTLAAMGVWRHASLFKLNRALAESESRFRATFEQAAVGICQVAPDGRIRRVNDKLCEILGYEPRELLALTFQDITHPDNLDADFEFVRRLLAGAIPTYSMEKRYFRKDGAVVWANLTAALVRDPSGKPDYFISVVEDISDRKAVDATLQETLTHLRHAQKIAKIDHWVWDAESDRLDTPGYIASVFGVASEELQGLSDEDYVERFVHPEDRRKVLQAYGPPLATQEAFDVEYRVLRPDGVCSYVREIGEPVFDGAGKPSAMFGTVQDITDLRRAEQSLRDSEAALAEAQKLAQIGTWRWSIEHDRLVYASDELARIHGVAPDELEELIKEQMERVIHPEDRERAATAFKGFDEEGCDYEIEYRILRADGEVRHVLEIGVTVFDGSGKAVEHVGTLQDVTEKKAVEERFRRYFDLPLVGAAIYRPDKRWIEVNDKLCDLLGYGREELMRLTWADLTHPDDLAENARLFDETMAGERDTYSMDKRFVRKDGAVLYSSISVQCLRKPSGAPDYFIELVQDLTERKRAEDLNTRLGRIVEDSINEIYVFDSESLRFVQVNRGARENLGYSMEELRALTPLDLKPEFGEKSFAELIRSLREGSKHQVVFSTIHRRKDGTTYDVEVRLQLARSETPPIFFAVIQDITERKRTEEALREREANLRIAQRIGNLGSWEWSIGSDTVHWSDEMFRIFGLDPQEHRPTPELFYTLVHPDDRGIVRSADEATAREGKEHGVEYRALGRDGSERVVFERTEVSYDGSGKAIRMHGIVHDITDRKRAEEEIRKLNEELEQRVEQRTAELRAAQDELVRKERLAALGQLTATVSHELRNPLGAMGVSVAAIKKLAGGDNRLLGRSVAVLDRSITRCDNIIGDLLDYSRVRPLEAESTALDGWLETLLDEYAVTPGVELRRELDSDATVALDPDRFHRAMVNLLDNACQAMRGAEGSGEVKRVLTVASRRIGDLVEFSVGDTGPGIAAEIKEKIFEPLFSTKSFGVGLGLPIVKRVVEQHDGGIEVESAPDQGTRFVMTLPVKEPMESVA